MTTNGISIIKRNGSKEPLKIEKIHKMVDAATKGINGVSASQVEMSANLSFYDGITTEEIQQTLIKSASDLISLDTPNYQYVASRLLLFAIRKDVFNTKWKDSRIYPALKDIVARNIEIGVYDTKLIDYYTEKEWDTLNSYMNHKRDFLFSYAGLRQVVDKYLVQDRSTGKLFESPQYMYMLISAVLFKDYPSETRLTYVKKYYDAMSQFKINIPTPVMAGVRTPLRQFASCVLVDTDDTLSSIFSSDMAIGRYVAQRAGIGINAGRIRGINSKIRGGEVQHTGVIPFSRNSRAQSAVALRMELGVGVLLSTSQSGIKKLRTSLFSKITKGQKTTG